MVNISAPTTGLRTPDPRPRPRRRRTVEECRSVTVDQLFRGTGVPPAGVTQHTFRWTGKNGATFKFTVAATRPRFGGLCWWLVCEYCGSRRRRLYGPPGATLGCRTCWDLGYRSQYAPQHAGDGGTASALGAD
ncbi:MAG: hypothetical protein ACRD19_06605 [Terriglobia bacterium]